MIDWLITNSDQAAIWLLTWSWQTAALLGMVWPGVRVLRPKTPALRHQIWTLSLAAVVALPIWNGVVAKFPLPQPTGKTLSYATALPAIILPENYLPPARPAIQAAVVKPAKKSPRLLPAVFFIWLTGSLICIACAFRNQFKLSRLRANAAITSYKELACSDCEDEAARGGGVSVGLSPEIRTPMLLGFRRPLILLPVDIIEWTDPAERCVIVRHELAHVARRDHWINLLQTLLHFVFYFHPLMRYASRQINLEREMACDDQVLSLGVEAQTYAETILKTAERSFAPGWTPISGHQLALISAKQILERRIEMILNKDRVRLIARQWRYLVLAGALMALGVWLLSPGRITRTGLAQPQPENTSLKLQLVKSMGDNKAYADLIEMALKNPDGELRRLAAIRLTEIEGDGSADAMFELYQKSDDPEVKQMVIDALARISEIEPLTKIALSETNDEYQRRALMRIQWLQEKELSSDIKVLSDNLRLQDLLNKLDSAPPPPPPPPPPPSSELTVVAGEPIKQFPWNNDKENVFALLHEMAHASIRRDASYFERILDEDYQETGPDGRVTNKQEAIADVKRMDYKIRKFEFDAVNYTGTERMGMANFLGTVYFEKDGQESTIQYRYTVNFIRRIETDPMTVLAIHISQKQ